MAPPGPRRAGFSRRAQYGLFASYVIAVAGMLLGLLLVITARFDPAGHAAVQGVLGDITAPIASLGRSIVDLGTTATDGVGAYIDAGSKNRAMEDELRARRSALLEAQATASENHRLKRLAGLVERTPDRIATARLIASSGASSRRYATLAAGSLQGVASGQPVRTSEGLIGRVVAAGRMTARVLMITDTGNVVPVRRLSDGMPALATGLGDGGIEIRALAAGVNPFRPGDVFVTSGAGGIYPPNVPVGIAASRTREIAIARPFADPDRLDFAIVTPPFVPAATDLPPVEPTP